MAVLRSSRGDVSMQCGEENREAERTGVGERQQFDVPAASDEDTEDASETDVLKTEEFTEIKEQMYKDKLQQLKRQLQQLQAGTLPEYAKRLKRIEQLYKERLRVNDVWQQYCLENIERRYVAEKKAAVRDLELKKVELKENLIAEWEEKKRQIEVDRHSLDLTASEYMDFKPAITRKLRSRPKEQSLPLPEKRRKQSPTQLNLLLDEGEVLDDLKILCKVSGKSMKQKPVPPPAVAAAVEPVTFEARIDEGRLYYEKRWYNRGQAVYIESKETGKFGALITHIGPQEIQVRKTPGGAKHRIYITQLQKGKFTLRRRST